MITGLLILDGTRSISRISREIGMKMEPSSLIKFVSQSSWDYLELQEAVRALQFQEALKDIPSDNTIEVFFSIDDRNLEKHKDSKDMSGFSWFFDHVEGRHIWARTVVTAHLSINGHSFFFGFHPPTIRKRLDVPSGKRIPMLALLPNLPFAVG